MECGITTTPPVGSHVAMLDLTFLGKREGCVQGSGRGQGGLGPGQAPCSAGLSHLMCDMPRTAETSGTTLPEAFLGAPSLGRQRLRVTGWMEAAQGAGLASSTCPLSLSASTESPIFWSPFLTLCLHSSPLPSMKAAQP